MRASDCALGGGTGDSRAAVIIAGLLFALGVTELHSATAQATRPMPDRAVSPQAASQPACFPPFAIDASYASGDWLGLRTQLEQMGISTTFCFHDTYQWNLKGGISTTSHNGATYDWFVNVDFDRMKTIPGGLLQAHIRQQWGTGINAYTGSIFQVADDLDGDRSMHVAQLWYEQRFWNDLLRLRLGYLDYQTIVDRNAFANNEDRQFLNLALDNNPLVPLNIGIGAALTIKPSDWLCITAGVGDAEGRTGQTGLNTTFHDSARFFAYLETGLHFEPPSLATGRPLPGNYRFGLVYDPRARPLFEDPRVQPPRRPMRGDDLGFYVSADQMLWRESADSMQGLGVFGRYAVRQGELNRVSQFWSVGLQYEGLFPSRNADVFGFGVAQGISSSTFREFVDPGAGSETVYELYYSIQVTRWLSVTPNIQYVSHPGLGSGAQEVIVAGVRARISL